MSSCGGYAICGQGNQFELGSPTAESQAEILGAHTATRLHLESAEGIFRRRTTVADVTAEPLQVLAPPRRGALLPLDRVQGRIARAGFLDRAGCPHQPSHLAPGFR